MKPEEQRIAIAEACGWKKETRKMYAGASNVSGWGKNQHLDEGHIHRQFTQHPHDFSDYLNNLNACHEMLETLDTFEEDCFAELLVGILKCSRTDNFDSKKHAAPMLSWSGVFSVAHAEPQQICEAFLKTLGLWKE